MTQTLRWTTGVGLIMSLWVTSAYARPIFVDNQSGSDGFDGYAATVQTKLTGPVQTLRQALRLARRGDEIILINTGIPYSESLTLSGARHSGYPSEPFVIRGNGAVLNGTASLTSDGWQRQSNGLWRLSLTRKGYYRFFRDGLPIAEQPSVSAAWKPDDILADHWASHEGAVYFRFDDDRTPITEAWSYAAWDFGVSLVDVRHVRIENLTIVGYRVDGINVDNACHDIELENLRIENHGRAGLAVGGSSRVTAINCRIAENGSEAVLITERGGLQLEACDLGGSEPKVIELK
ncbi:hypothetical protein GC163_14455 [bacterium]|nr:hypothetical protein [bacterium]